VKSQQKKRFLKNTKRIEEKRTEAKIEVVHQGVAKNFQFIMTTPCATTVTQIKKQLTKQ
jgi:uncharacterized protein YxjI